MITQEKNEKRKAYNRTYMRIWIAKNVEKRKKWRKENYLKNRNHFLQKAKEYRDAHKEERYLKHRIWRKTEHGKELERRYWTSEKRKATKKAWREKNKDKVRLRSRELQRIYRQNPQYRIASNLRRRMNSLITNKNKSASSIKLLGISLDDFKLYLETTWKPNMSWDNYGEWVLDHKIPLKSFDLLNPKEQKRAFHYTNYQALWAEENLRKGAKILN